MTPLAELIGESPGVVAVRQAVGRLLQRQSDRGRLPPILIQGETGTGKGLLTRAIHRASPRREGPFVDVNCAAIPETLLEAELFGYERGAFTDARHAKAGLFQTANHGTLFLDEVGLLPEGLQTKLLKALEDRAVRRLGSTRPEPIDIWIITASNDDLVVAARERRFREDLYHRLAVVTLRLPALRERGEDTLVLASHFLARACAEYGLRPKSLAPDARAALLHYRWPGNVRELVNVMERVALLSDEGVVTAEQLALPAETPLGPAESTPPTAASPPASLADALGSVERVHLLEALREAGWNVTHAAERLGISRDTLRYRIEKHGLSRDPAPRGGRSRTVARAAPARPPAPSVTRPASVPEPALTPLTVRWERRRVAFLRSAIALPADADRRLYPSRAVETLVEKVQSFGGRVEELSPSGLVGVFGLEPVEDATLRAAHAALAIHKAGERAARAGAERLAVTSAIWVAQVLVGAGSSGVQIDLEGKREAWTTLEALTAAAEPDGVTVGEGAVPFLARDFEMTLVGRVSASAGRAYRLVASERVGPGAKRRLATFVGRRHELDLLRSRLEIAIAGHGQAVGILGEAGMGKSRLVAEFLQTLDRNRVAWLEGRCHSYGSAVPYLPILDIVRRTCRITDTDPPATIVEKVSSTLGELAMDVDQHGPFLLHLLGIAEGTEGLPALTPSAIKARTFEALRQMGLQGARQRPVIFVIEDLHWIDATSEECLLDLMESLLGAPAMLVSTYRPGHRPPWVERSYATQMALQPLPHADGLRIIHSVLDPEGIAEPLTRLILDKTEGNPFFLEELSRVVADGEALGAVPDTIQEVLLARIERLPPAAKGLLQTASVLGREISLPLLRAIGNGYDDIQPLLHELARLEFLYLQSGGPEPVYAFTHTLTQEVAYESVHPDRRNTLHLAAARALEKQSAEGPADVDERLAYHYARTDRADRAVEYLTHAAARAARAHAHTEAVRILDEALSHVDRLPPLERERRRLDLALRQGSSLVPLGASREVVDRLDRHAASLASLDDPALAGPYHFLMCRSHLFRGDDEAAAQHAEAGIREARRAGDEATLGKIHYALAQRGALSGRPHEGLDHGRQATVHLERAGETWWLGSAHWALALNHGLLGEFQAGLEEAVRATVLGAAVDDPQVRSAAAWVRGIIHVLRGEVETGLEACRLAAACSPDPLNTALATGWLGLAHLESGDAAAAMPALEQSIRLLAQFHFPQPRAWFMTSLADAHRLAGQLEPAEELARRGLAMARAARSAPGVGWAEAALGRLARARSAFDDAAAHFAEALGTFAAIPLTYYVARTHLDLAVLSHGRGNGPAAARHLAEARKVFDSLGVPRYVERVDALASSWGVQP